MSFIWDGRRKPAVLRPSGGVDGGSSPGNRAASPLFSGMATAAVRAVSAVLPSDDADEADDHA